MRKVVALGVMLTVSQASASSWTPEAAEAFRFNTGVGAAASLGTAGLGGLVSLIGNGVTLKRPELRRGWQKANFAFSVLNLGAAFGWGVFGFVSWTWGDPLLISSELVHYAAGISGLGIAIASRAHEKDERMRLSISPMARGSSGEPALGAAVRLTW
jgi:hypothetical protein